ncbi:MAG TPA: hypothetical protein VGQ26_23390 [Streptosporangiaceae bacterium]|nr:hypothetical protein [Streptosporangiaceae bacterium]
MEKMEYYAVLGSGRTKQNPSGLVRRRMSSEGRIDEALQRNLTWAPSSAIVEWEYGDVGDELVVISEAEAQALIDRFREKWGDQGG